MSRTSSSRRLIGLRPRSLRHLLGHERHRPNTHRHAEHRPGVGIQPALLECLVDKGNVLSERSEGVTAHDLQELLVNLLLARHFFLLLRRRFLLSFKTHKPGFWLYSFE